MSGETRFIETNELTESHSQQAAELAYLAFEDFYGIFSKDRNKLNAAIAAQFQNYSELNQQLVALENDSVVGICSYYAIAEMPERQMAGVRALFAVADDLIGSTKLLRNFKQNFADPGSECAYIARLAVPANKKGSGLALDLLRKAESIFLDRGWSQVRLHVRKDNTRALAFYAKAGYATLDEKNLGYILLGKGLV